ncbi:MAG: type II toxin-antitoxin system VapC family toxin [Gemmatimonadota bacterium]
MATDTNVVAALFLSGPRTSQARIAFRKDNEWIAPHLWRSEFRNILVSYMRRRELSTVQALRLATTAERLFERREMPVRSERVLDLAAESGCTAYDCEFIAVAQDAGTLLVTDDFQLLLAFPGVAISLAAFVGDEST